MGRKQKSDKRSSPILDQKEIYLIFTEGEKTEKVYFESIKWKRKSKVIPSKNGDSASDQVYKKAEKTFRDYRAKGYHIKSSEVYIVIDRDTWSLKTLQNIEKQCNNENYNFLVSNPKFELWLALHQEKQSNGLSCPKKCDSEVKKIIPNFQKNNYSVETIKEHIQRAIDHAKRLDEKKTVTQAPSTTVYKLVEKLRIK